MSTDHKPSTSLAHPMIGRDPAEAHRVSTPLELLFDLCFVVAIAGAGTQLHHGLAAGHAGPAVLNYILVFFAIWWAWMNFTWFASAYDTDDPAYRLKALVQIAGVLVLAAGIPRAADHMDFSIVTLGFTVIRAGQIAMWLRAAAADAARRVTARRYALGLFLVQCGWCSLLLLPGNLWLVGWALLCPAELGVPMWAERAGRTPWHAHHIAERFGLLTLIVIGESVLAATTAIQVAIDSGAFGLQMVALILGALALLFSMWWLYFDMPAARLLRSGRSPFVWGYGHYFVFTSVAAMGAGLALAVDQASGQTQLHTWLVGAAVSAPVAVFLVVVGLLHAPRGRVMGGAAPSIVAAAVVLGASLSAWNVAMVGAALGTLVAYGVLTGRAGPSVHEADQTAG